VPLAERKGHRMLQSVDFVPPVTGRLSSPLLLPTGKREGNTSNTLNLPVHWSHLQEYIYKGQVCFFSPKMRLEIPTVSELGLMENP